MQLYKLKSTQLPLYLDIIMLILILLASICLFIEDSQYKFFIILIMFIYLFYFLLYRLDKYTYKRPALVLHQIGEDGRKVGDGSQERGMFVTEFEKRNMDRSRAGRGADDKDKSFTNYLNRSRRAQQSRSSISNIAASTNQFNFLSTPQRLLTQNLQNKTSSLNNSYIKHMLSHEVETKNIYEQKIKYLTEFTNKYVKTLQKYKISYQIANKCTHYIQGFCLELVRDFYQYNVNNLINIVQYVENNYDVRVIAGYQFSNLRGDRGKGQGIMQIQLDKLLDKLLSSKNYQPDLPKKTHFSTSPQKSSQFFAPRQPNTPQQIAPSLSEFCKTQQYLLNQFTTPKNPNLSGQGLLKNLQNLRTYIDNEQNQQKQYEYLPGSKLSEDQSQRLLLAFNVCRNKINQIVGETKFWLNWELQGYFGWIRKQNGRFVVKTRLADYGHPYLYIEDEGNGHEEIYAEPGRNNIYSTLMLYLWNLQHKQIGYIRQNQRLSQIITKYLSVLIL